MFEPDGRNSIQYVGHMGVTLVRWVCMVFALACLLPTYLVLRGWQTMKRQEAGIEAVNTDPRIERYTLDFNRVTLQPEDADAYQGFKDSGFPEDRLDPSLNSLPFTITGRPAAWVYYNLPFDANVVVDRFYGRAKMAEGVVDGPYNLVKADPLRSAVDLYDGARRIEAIEGDPLVSTGLFKLAPTKWWDWYSSLELVQAKAAPNYAAYAGAARVTARMRALAAGYIQLGDKRITQDNEVPARVLALNTAPDQRTDFWLKYTQAFQGDLPVIDIEVQPLDEKALTHDPQWAAWIKQAGDDMYGITEQVQDATLGGYITGIRLTGDTMGRPDFTRMDYLLNSRAQIDDASHRAQAKLQAMMTYDFWAPLFMKRGMGDPETLEQVQRLLVEERTRLGRDVQFAHLHGHEAFHHNETL
jgi:hypothetical protein